MARRSGISDIDIEMRRELVDSLDCIGVKRCKIVETLKKKGLLDGYQNPLIAIKADLTYVRKKRLALLYTGQKDKTVSEFIAQQIEILMQAMGATDYKTAVEASKNIAKARGFNIDKIVLDKIVLVGGDTDDNPVRIQQRVNHSIDKEEAKTVFGILREAGGLLPVSYDAETNGVHTP